MRQLSRRDALRRGALAAVTPTSLGVLLPPTRAYALTEVATETSRNPFINDIHTTDPDAFVWNWPRYIDTDRDRAPLGARNAVDDDLTGDADDLHHEGRLAEARASDLTTSANRISATILQSVS